ADARRFARARTPRVAGRLRVFDRLTTRVEVRRREVQETPIGRLIVDLVADRRVDETVERETLVRHVIRVRPAEIREHVAEDLVSANAFARLAGERTIDDRHAPVERHLRAERRLRAGELRDPEVLRDTIAPRVAGADPHDVTLVVDLI